MYLRNLSIFNFKNIREAELSFSPELNCVIGSNGMGKTNLLDAIYFLSMTKSRFMLTDAQTVSFGEEMLYIRGSYNLENDEPSEIYGGIKLGQRKAFKRDGKEYDRIADHIGLVPLVMITPDDQELISGSGDVRRKFLNAVISQFDAEYLNATMNFNRALAQRNSLLKSRTQDPLMYEMWEEQMAATSDYIYRARSKFIEAFEPLFQYFYDYISQGSELISIRYKSQINEGSDYFALLGEMRERDALYGHTTIGVHRDDIDMSISGAPIRRIGSQGQCKTFLIALKFAQYVFLRQVSKKTPIMLLDDVFDKLDSNRVRQIISLLKEDDRFGQIFMTDTDREHISTIIQSIGGDYRIFEAKDGMISLSDSKSDNTNAQ